MFSKLLKYFNIFLIVVAITILGTNILVITITKDKILTIEEAKKIDNIACILVLGAGIRGNNPSPMLEDRLQTSQVLYNQGLSPKILVSGDHTKKDYDEVNVMKDYLTENSIPSQDIFMDHAGISTYDSIYRAKEIFNAKKIIIVTQEYHLYRALYLAEELGLDAYGIASNHRNYTNQTKREIREILARTKDFLKGYLKPQSTYLGEKIDLNQNGNITNDNNEFLNKSL